jgi:hypothetical protein
MTDTYITVSGTAITVDEDYDVTLLVENFVGSVTRNFTGTVLPTPVAPEIITTSLGDLQVGVPFDTEVVWTGTTPFTAVDSFFDDLPDGITPYLIGAGLDRFGFHGTPTTAGPYSFTVRVGNVAGYDTQLFSGEIAEGSVAPTITTTDLGDLTEDEAFSLEIEYTGSTATAVSVVSGSLPGGLNVDLTAGVVTVSGTPTTPGAYSFTLRVTNGTGHDDQAFSGTVNATPAGPVITTTDLGYMEVAVPFIKEILYTGEPATGRSDSGEPAGLFSHVNEDGTVFVTGTPTEAGPYSYTITLTNADGSGSKTFEGEVAPEGSPPSFVTTSLGEVGHDYYFLKFISYASGTSLTAAEVISGALPTGLSLNVSPVFIAGTPSVLGEEYDFTLRLTNAGGGFVDHEFTGTVVEATAPTVTTTSLGTLYVGVPFSVEIEYTGSPITSYSLPFDPLPDGFEVDLTDGVVTISGTPVATGGYTFDLRVDNVTSFATQTFSGTIMEVPAARGGFDLALVVGGPLVTNTFADTIVFHAMIIDVVGDPEFDPSTVTLSVDGRTTLTPLVTPVALVTGAPYYAAAYIVHGLEAGIHTISVSANVVIYGTAVSYPGITGHGAVTATPLTDPMLTQEIESTEGTLISQGYSLPALFDPLEYGQTPRYTGLYTMGGEAVAPATFTYDLNGFLALSGMTWEDLATYGYSFTGIAIELTGTPTDSPVITLDVLDPGGNPFFVGRTGYKQIIVSTGADDWSVVSGAFPTGMTFDTDKAVLYGIATTEEEYSVTVRASNANGHVDKTYTGTVHPTPIPEITTTSIAPFTVGGYYSQYFVATNYTVGTYDMGRTWSVSAGALPDGVSLVDYLGQLTGTPTTVGPYSFTIKVESQYGSDEVEFTGTVSA